MSSATERPGIKPTVGLTILLGSLTMFGPISIDMYLPGLPAIASDLESDAAGGQLTIASFLFGLAVGQIIYGPLSDRIGRRPPLTIGISLFVVVSIGCTFATSIEALIGLRFLQALGASVGMVIARAVIADLFEGQEAARMFSLVTLVFGLAPILAPLIGGWMLLVMDWRAIFWVLALFGGAVLTAALMRLKESRSKETEDRAREESPLRAYLAVTRQKRLIGFGLAGAFGGSCMLTYIAASPSLLIETYGIAPENYGYIFGLNAIGFVAAAQVNRHFLIRHSIERLLMLGLTGALVASLIMLIAAITYTGESLAILVPLFVVITSLGFVMPNGVAGAMAVDRQRSGTAGALVGCLQFVVGSIGAICIGIFYDGSALPMAATIAGALALAILLLKSLVKEPD